MGRRVIDVFLGSTAVDLADYRKAVDERLMRTGLFDCVRQEIRRAERGCSGVLPAKGAGSRHVRRPDRAAARLGAGRR